MPYVNDTFTEASETALSSHTGETGASWTQHSAGTGTLTVSAADRVFKSDTGNPGIYYASGTPAGVSQSVEFVLRVVSSPSGAYAIGATARMDTSANTFYHARHRADTNNWELFKFVAGTSTSLGSYSQALSVSTSYTGRLDCLDAIKRLAVGGVTRIASADNVITSAGRAGLRFSAGTADTSSTGYQIDSLTARNVTVNTFYPSANESDGSADQITNPNNLHADDGSYGTGAVSTIDTIIGRRYTTFGTDGTLLNHTIIGVWLEWQAKNSGAGNSVIRTFARVDGADKTAHDTVLASTSDTDVAEDVTADDAFTPAKLDDGSFKAVIQFQFSGTNFTVSGDYLRLRVESEAPEVAPVHMGLAFHRPTSPRRRIPPSYNRMRAPPFGEPPPPVLPRPLVFVSQARKGAKGNAGRTIFIRKLEEPGPIRWPRWLIVSQAPRGAKGNEGRLTSIRPWGFENVVITLADMAAPAMRVYLKRRVPSDGNFIRITPPIGPLFDPTQPLLQPIRVLYARRPRGIRRQLIRWRPTQPPVLSIYVTGRADGLYRVSDATLDGYLLYRGVDAEPDLTGAAWETFAALPHTTAALAADTDYYFVTRRRNRYNLISQNATSTLISIAADGTQNATKPSAPTNVTAEAAIAGTVKITAQYAYDVDGTNQADAFLVYVRSDGTNPDPSVDTPTEVAMGKDDGTAYLEHTTIAYSEGTLVKALVRTRRNGSPDVDSSNLTPIVSATATLVGPDRVDPAVGAIGTKWVQQQST